MKRSYLSIGILFLAHSASAGNLCTLPTATETGYDVVMAEDSLPENKTARTDYYKLAINWSADHCKKMEKKVKESNDQGKPEEAKKIRMQNAFQCFSNNKFSWVLHGLWAQSCDGKSMTDCRNWSDIKKHPRYCKGDLPEVAFDELKPFMCNSPGAKLLQGEWEKHGACTFETAKAFHEKAGELFSGLKLPDTGPNTPQLLTKVKTNNPQLAGKNLLIDGSEFYICYDLQFAPINCPPKE
ncbi:MAG: hypothetical protein RL748_1856 [Pseudomonadota bacterium]